MPLGAANLTPQRESVSCRFGRRLRGLRMSRGLTQMRVAIEFGIDRVYLSHVERGMKSISLPMLEKIADGFNIPLDALLKDL